MKLIDKERVVAEIEKRLDKLYNLLPDASKVENGVCVDTNNEFGNGISINFICKNCGHRWYGRRGITIDNYTEIKEE